MNSSLMQNRNGVYVSERPVNSKFLCTGTAKKKNELGNVLMTHGHDIKNTSIYSNKSIREYTT
jgi:hypothetical protein